MANLVWFDMVWCGLEQFGLMWIGTIWIDMGGIGWDGLVWLHQDRNVRTWFFGVMYGFPETHQPTFSDVLLPLSSDNAPGSHLLLVKIEMV